MNHKSELWRQRKTSVLERIQKQFHYLDSKGELSRSSCDLKAVKESSIIDQDIHMRKRNAESSATYEELWERATQSFTNDEWKEGVMLYNELYSVYLNSVSPESLGKLVEILLQKTKTISRLSIHQHEHFLHCRLCLGVLYNPVSLECGHSFCKKCCESNAPKICVICNSAYDDQTLNQSVSLDSILQYLRPKQYESSRLRTEGNNLFAVMDFSTSLQKYSESIAKDGESHISFSNRSHVNSLLGKFEESLEDAERIISLKPYWLKGHYRKGIALLGLGRNQEAAISFFKSARLDSTNNSVKHCLCKALHDMLLAYTLQTSIDTSIDSGDEPWRSCQGSEEEAWSLACNSHPLLCFIENCLSIPSSDDDLKGACNEGSQETFPPAPPETVCVLCARFIYDPVTTPCGHISCMTCLNRSLDHRPYCPVCRAELHEYVALKQKRVTEVLDKVIQTCWPEDYTERKQQHDEEIARLASVAHDAPEEVPVFVCTPALPSVICLLHVFEPRYRLMMRQCMESGSRQFGMCAFDPQLRFANFGTMLVIRELQYLADGRSLVDSVGERRFKVLERGMRDGYNTAKVEWIKDTVIPDNEKASSGYSHW